MAASYSFKYKFIWGDNK